MAQAVTADTLLERARARTRLDDVGPENYREMLDLWVADAAGKHVSEAGSAAMLAVAERNLGLRLRLIQTFNEHPEIDRVELPPIIFISGFVRSGTTLLHTLLGLHPAARTIRRWELVSPLPPPESSTWADDPRIAKVQGVIETLRGSGLERLHWVEANDAEECTHGYYDCSGLLGRGGMAAAPSWWARLHVRDERPTLREYQRLLKLLLWRNPPPQGSVLVLKNPTTAAHLAAFADVFPDARVVLTHRDPYRCASSACRVGDVVSRPYYAPGVGFDSLPGGPSAVADSLCIAADSIRRFAARTPSAANVLYADLMADPVATTAGVLSLVGQEVPDDWERRVRGLLEWQRSGGRAAPPASYDIELTREQVWKREEMLAYTQAFGVQAEHDRVTDPTG